MRTGWKLTATAFGVTAAMVLAGCGSDSADSSSDTATVTTLAVTTTAASTTVATVATTVAPATTTTVAPTTAPPTTAAFAGPGAAEQLAAFLAAYDGLTEQLPTLLDEVSAEADSGVVSDELYDRTNEAGGDVYDLTRLVPVGLAPTVHQAVHDAVMMVAAASSAYLFAPGWELLEWADWRAGMAAAQEQLGAMRAIVVEAATEEPQMTVVVPGSREEAAGSMLLLEVGRRFGHGGPGAELDAAVPFVHWVGALRGGSADGSQCFVDAGTGAFSPVTGDFVDGVGGCAVVFYDGIDHADEIEAWRASGGETFPSGEFVAFVRSGSGWEAVGSVE